MNVAQYHRELEKGKEATDFCNGTEYRDGGSLDLLHEGRENVLKVYSVRQVTSVHLLRELLLLPSQVNLIGILITEASKTEAPES